MAPRDAIPASRMDPARSALSGLVDELASSERFRAFLEDFPVPARVSEPALALVLAALHEALARPLVCLLAEDEEARDIADYVLAPFDAHDDREAIVARAADAVEIFVSEGLEETQRRFN